jgi:ribosomal peptide maturation radical SAM protein 1
MDVAFAVVPFADISRPAIGVSLLKAALTRRGFSSTIHYFNVDFAETVGDQLYRSISNDAPADSLVGEWFFADLVFPGELPPEHEFVRNILMKIVTPDTAKRLLEHRSCRTAFIERCAQTLKASGAPIVGFTTTFHQTCACLAIAKRLKELPAPPLICFGGANCEGEMGFQLLRSFPWIDYVCTREGDFVFPEFVERVLHRGDAGPLPGFLCRGESQDLTYPPIITDLDSLPIPNYEDYVDQLKDSPLDSQVRRELQIETARGCWWGAKHHCTFCGLNGDTMPYRSKSPDRVYEELKYLYECYGVKRIDSVDNILDHRYITTVFPRLVAEGIELEMFYEVKANLKYAQLLAMKRGGIAYIQPGIESFSTTVLKLMNKGVTGAQNVQLLKWAEEIGVVPAWNILAGFPDEPPSEYTSMARLIPLLTHLEPPTGCTQIRLDRFSPLFNNAAAVGFQRVRPTLAYYYVFPLGRRELARLAYFFDFDYADGRKPEHYTQQVQNEIVKWRNARFREDTANRPRLDALIREKGVICITDTRECAVVREHWLNGLEAKIFLACDAAQPRQTLAQQFAAHPSEAINDALERLLAARLFAQIDHVFLSLPVLRNRPPTTLETQSDGYRPIPTASDSESLLRVL